MDNPIWSHRFAREIGETLGYPMPETAPDGRDEVLLREGERLVAETTDSFRYLPLEQVNWAHDLASFLRAREANESMGPRPYGWPVEKLREIHGYVLFLRGRFGYEEPVDESDEWTDEDRRDLQIATWRRLDEDWP